MECLVWLFATWFSLWSRLSSHRSKPGASIKSFLTEGISHRLKKIVHFVTKADLEKIRHYNGTKRRKKVRDGHTKESNCLMSKEKGGIE